MCLCDRPLSCHIPYLQDICLCCSSLHVYQVCMTLPPRIFSMHCTGNTGLPFGVPDMGARCRCLIEASKAVYLWSVTPFPIYETLYLASLTVTGPRTRALSQFSTATAHDWHGCSASVSAQRAQRRISGHRVPNQHPQKVVPCSALPCPDLPCQSAGEARQL